MLEDLRQYLNNHPQYYVKVNAKERPDGTIAIFTYWFEDVPQRLKRGNINVPSKRYER
jgi:hypothetical protein